MCFSMQFANANCKEDTCHTERKESSVVESQYMNVIEHSDSVVWFLIDPMSEDSATARKLGEILSCETDTLEERKGACVATLAYLGSFVKSNMVKECTFLPDVAINFYSHGNKITFAYSFYCDLCRFISGDIYQELDGELVRSSILKMACEVFPKDRYLRQLKRRER